MERQATEDIRRLYGALLGLSGLFTLAAVLTLVPNPRASWENVLGYSPCAPSRPSPPRSAPSWPGRPARSGPDRGSPGGERRSPAAPWSLRRHWPRSSP
ncbi:MAG: hypothetical protein MZV65_15850 [Chromatiales bacterium]|nr:hypothetical protein [Chromatiales bacterium]